MSRTVHGGQFNWQPKKSGAGNSTGDYKMIWDDFQTEINTITPMTGSAEEFLALGMRYCLGQGVEQNNVMAHKWFNIAAIKGNENARSYLFELSSEMTAAEILEAQRQARSFLTVH